MNSSHLSAHCISLPFSVQDGTSPLFAALESGTYGIVAELIAKGANVNAIRVSPLST